MSVPASSILINLEPQDEDFSDEEENVEHDDDHFQSKRTKQKNVNITFPKEVQKEEPTVVNFKELYGGKSKMIEVRWSKSEALTESMLVFFPEEVMLRIISLLSPTEIARICRVSKDFNRICNEEILWKHIYCKLVKIPLYKANKQPQVTWKRKYIDSLSWKGGEFVTKQIQTNIGAYASGILPLAHHKILIYSKTPQSMDIIDIPSGKATTIHTGGLDPIVLDGGNKILYYNFKDKVLKTCEVSSCSTSEFIELGDEIPRAIYVSEEETHFFLSFGNNLSVYNAARKKLYSKQIISKPDTVLRCFKSRGNIFVTGTATNLGLRDFQKNPETSAEKKKHRGELKLWDLSTGEQIHRFHFPANFQSSRMENIHCLEFLDEKTIVSVSGFGHIHLWNMNGKHECTRLGRGNPIEEIKYPSYCTIVHR